ncbi:MAG: glycosyltransferase family 2 protein [Candidatus Moraniibacteriota bacterium]|nr:MAG: glycosyltransferase family 2 protein [Candidatus Moranbacteria bacterium]
MNVPPLVFIVILNYNARATIFDCLKSVLGLEAARFEVLVVDNFSTDGSFDELSKRFPKIHTLQNGENGGFARGVNSGIRAALQKGADFIWLLNPDTLVQKDALFRLLEFATKYPDVGLVSPLLLSPETNTVWFGGGTYQFIRQRVVHTPPTRKRGAYETDFISGCAPLIHKEVFRKIGLFDETFFLYYEDADFSLRAKKAGFRLIVLPEALVFHSEASTTRPEKLFFLVRSGLFFFWKHTPLFLRPLFWLIIFSSLRPSFFPERTFSQESREGRFPKTRLPRISL